MIKRLMELVTTSGQPLPGMPIVELVGNKRVLIENHLGITEYETERIGIQVKYGKLTIIGEALEICCMSGQQLVITGKIDSILVERGHNE